ncbi:MAG TPA: lipopolysaccharide kinase InaA family protein [Gemmatimonadaceae bacterium]|nr:lipopolysaccharide kinase InaA family protein [Gemmatimonadaceae bacterium]
MTGAPAGYTRFLQGTADVVALGACAEAVRRAVAARSLYDYAANHPGRRELRGRGVAYAVPLPGGETRVVVRHSRHGGLLAPVTGDRFFPPTRAPHELRTALRLAESHVPTPEVIAYATYPAGAVFRRSDVATREVTGGKDLADVLARPDDGEARSMALGATAELLRALERAGARHPDLNVTNVLIVATDGWPARALVLDVDRVVFGEPGDARIGAANVRRLLRSARKLRSSGWITASEDELSRLAAAAGHEA